jgi:hypothetical protein
MRESRTYGSVRGAPSDGRPYRDPARSPGHDDKLRRRALAGAPGHGICVRRDPPRTARRQGSPAFLWVGMASAMIRACLA